MLKRKLLGNPIFSEVEDNNNKKPKLEQIQDLLDLSLGNCSPGDVSKYFPNLPKEPVRTVQDKVLDLQLELNRNLRTLSLKTPPVEYIYNPLEYAFHPNTNFITKYCTTTKKILFIGMNPGPFGMCQTGVPFGDPRWVRDWLQIDGIVSKPEVECPERKILGFSSTRREQSGERFWSYFASLCGRPEVFFKYSFVCNFCPLALMKVNGCNVTPAEIKDMKIRKILEAACDDWYLKLIRVLQPEIIVAIGTYIEKKTKDLFKTHSVDGITVAYMPHPSPRAVNNQNWHEKAEAFLVNNNLMPYFLNHGK
ncbi:single-strand selective monofunctional uracil DNA glycosylase isoform X1 [Leptinotarsa decemlineata]|uniref:single-strand selective monofunctional uracil DNA glycosylase isoform X1 n=1 Tax=Leptinotarsa decemlineata TaxID=7539 RepID=UPI003D30CB25